MRYNEPKQITYNNLEPTYLVNFSQRKETSLLLLDIIKHSGSQGGNKCLIDIDNKYTMIFTFLDFIYNLFNNRYNVYLYDSRDTMT